MSFPEVPRLSLDGLDELLEHYQIRCVLLYNRNPELQEKFNSSNTPDFYRYADTEGVLYFRELQETAIPFPASKEMLTVSGETDLRIFLDVGHQCYDAIRKHIPEEKDLRILDFGVGCARTMRHFYRTFQNYDLYGCDVDEAAIGYIQNSVPFIKATATGNNPPLPYESDYFDFIYSISVLTHLNARALDEWVQELARITRPEGLVVPTIHGSTAFEEVLNNTKRRAVLGIKEDEFEAGLTSFRETGFCWMSQAAGSENIDTDQYGICFIDDENLEQLFGPTFKVLSHTKGEIEGWQDVVVLQKV
ncbi:hypothetical protein Enr10x_19110 [Gimesia panareensis]|uniref:Methyltransferase domain-containing protein n=1 Tax=Gimesia panareensis TaxID=2527978 RepID=A0A517Q4S9_9PLAN|nr:class I SAM-dependent methyltransferase [Gimesia panareensis]QDT26607.1 hypothetical protein Enr10x_19110 [Gimesia panareensis]